MLHITANHVTCLIGCTTNT